ncbi:hypothetical protein LCGC14_2761060, partial [marine sediment metagenome]
MGIYNFTTTGYFIGDGSLLTGIIAESTYNATYAAYAYNVSLNYSLLTYTNWNDIWISTYN